MKLHNNLRSSSDVVAQVLGFIDDEDGELFGLGSDETGDFCADGAVGGGARAFGGQPHLPTDRLVHVEHVAGGERDVVDAVLAGMERGGDVAAAGEVLPEPTSPVSSPMPRSSIEVLEARLGLAA